MKAPVGAKELKNLVSKDKLRLPLSHVYFDAEHGVIVATDGHVMGIYHVEVGKNDISALLPLEAFTEKKIDRETTLPEIEVRENVAILTYKDGEKREIATLDINYASNHMLWTRFCECAKIEPTGEIYFNLELMTKIQNSIPSKDKRVKITLSGPNKAAYITPLYSELQGDWKFLIMPIGIKNGNNG